MPNDKGILNELDRILFKYALVMPQDTERAKAIGEILSALSVPDEKLKAKVEHAILEDNRHFNYVDKAVDRIFSLIAPIIAAREQKLRAEMVTPDEAIKANVEKARIEERKGAQEIFTAYDKYVQLLSDELDEVVGMAFSHGWKSHRFEDGAKCREAIRAIKVKFEIKSEQPRVSREESTQLRKAAKQARREFPPAGAKTAHMNLGGQPGSK